MFLVMVATEVLGEDGWDYKLALSYGQQQLDGGLRLVGEQSTTNVEHHQLYNIESQSIGLDYRFLSHNQWLVKGHYNWLLPNSGRYQGKYFNQADLDQPYALLQSQISSGDGSEFELAFGPQWRWQQRLGVSPLLAYRQHKQGSVLQQGNYTICDNQAQPHACQASLGAVHGLDSKLQTSWQGWLYGVDIRWLLQTDWTLAMAWLRGPQRFNSQIKWNRDNRLQQPLSQTLQSTVNSDYLQFGLSYALSKNHRNLILTWHQARHGSASGISRYHLTNGVVEEHSMLFSSWRSQGWKLALQQNF